MLGGPQCSVFAVHLFQCLLNAGSLCPLLLSCCLFTATWMETDKPTYLKSQGTEESPLFKLAGRSETAIAATLNKAVVHAHFKAQELLNTGIQPPVLLVLVASSKPGAMEGQTDFLQKNAEKITSLAALNQTSRPSCWLCSLHVTRASQHRCSASSALFLLHLPSRVRWKDKLASLKTMQKRSRLWRPSTKRVVPHVGSAHFTSQELLNTGIQRPVLCSCCIFLAGCDGRTNRLP